MLFADVAHRNGFAVAVGDGATKHALGFKDALAVMSQRTMSRVGELFLSRIKPIVNGDVIFWLASEDFG